MHTIVAIATPAQNASVGIIRLSGPHALCAVLPHLQNLKQKPLSTLKPRLFTLVNFISTDETILDRCLAVFMPGPNSFTGEDVVELHCHGNVHLLRQIVGVLLRSSDHVRAAEPGEFSKRAFLNGKMDLTQAEAVHSLISSSSEAALQASLSNLDGKLSRIVATLRDDLKTTLALIEASFEFPEEDIQTFDRSHFFELLHRVQTELSHLKSAFHTSKILDSGISVAILGPPNVGKSSLLNALLVEDRSIVTDIPGTTRDVVESCKMIGGLRFVFKDTAGLRATDDVVESAGIQKSLMEAKKAHVVLILTDNPEASALAFEASPTQVVLRILNKIDLCVLDGETLADTATRLQANGQFDCALSLYASFGIDVLEKLLLQHFQNTDSVHNIVHINERQFHKILKCIDIIEKILKRDIAAFAEELVADELRLLISTLGEITGEISSDEVLGEIFSRFCIGK